MVCVRVREMFWNQMEAVVVQACDYSKHHRTICFRMVSSSQVWWHKPAIPAAEAQRHGELNWLTFCYCGNYLNQSNAGKKEIFI